MLGPIKHADDDGRKAHSIDGDRSDQALRQRARARQCESQRCAGQHLRAAWSQWIGKIDAHPRARRLSSARRGRRAHSWRGAEPPQARGTGTSGGSALRPPGSCAYPGSFDHRTTSRWSEVMCAIGSGTIRWRREEERVRRELASVGVEASPSERVAHLGPVDRTLVAIARALDRLDGNRNILVLDEPTARLPQSEAAKLIARLVALEGARSADRLRDAPARRGLQARRRGDRAAGWARGVQRPAVHAQRRRSSSTDHRRRRRGRTGCRRPPAKSAGGKAVLEVIDVSSQRLTNVNLTVQRGEVLGVTGLIGSGRSELGRIVVWPAIPNRRRSAHQRQTDRRGARIARRRLHPAGSARGSLSRPLG